MVRQAQKVDQLRQPEGVFGESPLRQQKEDGRGWFSKITAIFKGLGRSKVDNQVREKVVRDGGTVPAKKGNRVSKPTGVRSNNTSKTSGKSPRQTVRAPASKSKSKSKTV